MREDQRLLESFSSGDESDINTLIALYEDGLFNLCCKLASSRTDAEDLYQQTWLKVVQYAHTYRQKSLKNWLYTICLNIYRDGYRKDKRRQYILGSGLSEQARDYALSAATNNISAEHTAIDGFTQKTLAAKIDRLPDKLRLPVMLHYYEELDYNEIAQMMKIPLGTVKSRLNAARKRLRDEMENELHV